MAETQGTSLRDRLVRAGIASEADVRAAVARCHNAQQVNPALRVADFKFSVTA